MRQDIVMEYIGETCKKEKRTDASNIEYGDREGARLA